MSTTWQSLVTVGRPSYSAISDVPTLWQRIPAIASATGFGFGQGGFGQGPFGGGSSQTGTPTPNWTRWTTD
jgi:hypothetical protein